MSWNEITILQCNRELKNQLSQKRLEEFNLIIKNIKQLSNRTLNEWNGEIHNKIIVPRIKELREEALKKHGLNGKEKYIGNGQSADILLCTDEKNQEVAVKIIPKDITALAEMAIINEQYALNETKHIKNENIVKYKSSFNENGEFYFVMDYVDGKNLSAIAPKDREQVIGWGRQILCGLQSLHDKCIAHRDIKSENVLLDKNGNIKICDYGLAKDSNSTKTFCGSKGMVPPEVLKHAETSPELWPLYDGTKFDVYSTAATVYRILFNKKPEEMVLFTENIHSGKPFPLSKHSKDRFGNSIGNDLYEFFNKCLSADPNNRPTTRDALNLLSA